MLMQLCDKISSYLKIDCDAILLSGGLDSSILAIHGIDKLKYGITIAYKDAPDLPYAKKVAERCKLEHIIKNISDEEVLQYAKSIIRIMRVFDPMEIRNSIVIYASLLEAKSNNLSCIITGDGADELFAGYNYLIKFDYTRLNEELKRLWNIMHFSSIMIGKEVGVNVCLPYLNDEFIKFAKGIPIELKVKEYNGIRYGKWILRECFKNKLGEEIALRKKVAMEEGSGLNKLLFDNIGDKEYKEGIEEARNDGVKIKSKEHLYYYKIFKELYGIPKMVYHGNVRCADCLSAIQYDARFCKICGAFPVKFIYTS